MRKRLAKGIEGLSQLLKFAPYVAGSTFTLADCSAIVNLPLVSMASKAVYGEDLLAHLPVKAYTQQMAERASVQKVNADRKACMALMAERAASKPN